jgi:multidrug efflux pump subunit AcrA (membrane-fusion protein)
VLRDKPREFGAIGTARILCGVAAGIAGALLAGCNRPAEKTASAAEQPGRTVTVVQPERKTIRREVGQPGVIQAFERTPIVARIPGYVLKWNVDIGDPIRKNDVLAELWVPEMVSELKLKEEQVEQAKKALAMAQAQVLTAKAQVQEAEAAVTRAEATHNYWKSQSARFTSLVKESVLDKQAQEETLDKLQSAAAALAEVQARIASARALQQEKESARDKAEADIRAADADRQREADLVGYAKLTAPYDGVVTEKNVDTRKFVQPATGAKADVLYVVERTDIVRVFVSVPETDAAWVNVGTPATVRVQALQGQEFTGNVTRTSWSLNQTTRTLLTEIDLPNPVEPGGGRRLRPGMYAYGKLTAQWNNVLTMPASAVGTEGDVNVGYQTFCFLVQDGHVKRTPVAIGARNSDLVEVLKKRVAGTSPGDQPRWEPFSGKEQIVRGDLSGLTDGQAVVVNGIIR